jgi:hypothetical protein
MKINYSLLSISFSFLLIALAGCRKCPGETRISPDLTFNSSAIGIKDIFNPDELNFIDASGNSFSFVNSDSFSGFEKEIQTMGVIKCENGNNTDGYYLSEKIFKQYKSVNGDEINVSLFSWNPVLVLAEYEILPETFSGRDIFEVELIFSNCDTLRESRFVQLNNGNSNVLESGFSLVKFNQRHDSVFSVGALSYPGDMIFAHNKGLVVSQQDKT